MNPTYKTLIIAVLAAATEPLIQAATEGPVQWDHVGLRSFIAAISAVILYLKQSPLPPSGKGE